MGLAALQIETPCCPLCGGAVPEDDLVFVYQSGLVRRGGREARLVPMCADIFSLLLEARPRALSKDQLMRRLYRHEQDEPDVKIIDVQICRMRKVLAPLGITIETHWGRGYSLPFTGDVQALPAPVRDGR